MRPSTLVLGADTCSKLFFTCTLQIFARFIESIASKMCQIRFALGYVLPGVDPGGSVPQALPTRTRNPPPPHTHTQFARCTQAQNSFLYTCAKKLLDLELVPSEQQMNIAPNANNCKILCATKACMGFVQKKDLSLGTIFEQAGSLCARNHGHGCNILCWQIG